MVKGQGIRRDRFTGAMFLRGWIPALASSIGWSLSDIADAVVVGQHLGTVGLAAISLILPVYMINCAIVHGLGTGGSARYAALMAQGKRKEASRHAAGIGVAGLLFSLLTAVLGLVFLTPLLKLLGTVPENGAVFDATRDYLRIQLAATPLFYFANLFNYYLRNDGKERQAGIGSVTGNFVDMALNVILVLVLKKGTGGAALATAIGQVISIAIYLPGILSGSRRNRSAGAESGTRSLLRTAVVWLRIGLHDLFEGMSVSIQYLLQMVFLLLCNHLLLHLGGEEGIAVFDVLQNTSYLILYLYEGTARAMQPVASTYYGEKNEQGLRSLFRIGFTAGIGAGLIVILLAVIRPQILCLLFGLAGSGAEVLACTAIRIFAFGAFFAGISILLCNFFQATGDPRWALLLEFLRGSLVLLPVTLLCSSWGLEGFWWLFPITDISSLVILMLWMRIRRKPLIVDRMIAPERVFRRTIPSTATEIGQASEDLEEFCDRWEATPRQKFAVMNTVEELGIAILNHGFEGRKDGYIQITVLAAEEGCFELHLRDDAVRFNPFSLKGGDIRVSEDLDATGMLLIRKQAKDFSYRHFQGFNTLIISV